MNDAESLRARAVELGNHGSSADARELAEMLKSPAPMVRRAAASAIGKLLERAPGLEGEMMAALTVAAGREERPQVLQYMLKALRRCEGAMTAIQLDVLRDVARNPNHPQYVREAANEAAAAGEAAAQRREARLRHWCARCGRVVDEGEARRGIDRYGRPYCHHCLQEKEHEDALFTTDVEAAKRLRTVDEVAVQSRGGPDFYLPEFDLYIEYWGMDTPEYVANMRKKQVLYQRERKKLISLGFRDFDRLEQLLEEKLSRYVPSL